MLLSVVILGMCVLPCASEAGPPPNHNLHFVTPATTWDEALPLGNGLLGALVWGDGHPLTISVDRTDLWDLRPVPEFRSAEYSYETMRQWEKEGRYDDLKRVYEEPFNRPAPTKIPAGRILVHLGASATFQHTELELGSAVASTAFAGESRVKVWISATEPLGVIEVTSPQAVKLELVAPAFSGTAEGPATPSIVAGELTQLGYPPSKQTSGERFAAYEQEGWGGFSFAVYLGWRYAEAEQRTLAMWSVASSFEAGGAPLALAKERVERGLDGDMEGLHAAHTAWWDAYWANTWLRVPNERVERQWYRDTYKFGAATRADTPPITLQGPWTCDDGKLPPWKGEYAHDTNTEMSYWPAYSGNRLDGEAGFIEWLWENRDACKEWTRRFFNMPGMAVPVATDLHCNPLGGWRQYTQSATVDAWLAQCFYWHWRYTADPTFLKERAYPYLFDCAVFLEAVTNERDAEGKRTLPLSSSPEINDNSPQAWFPSITNHDNALIRWLFAAAARMADELGKTEDAARWRTAMSEMPELALGNDGALLIAKGFPCAVSHRHFSHLMGIFPLGIVDVSNGDADQRVIRASLAELERCGSEWWVGFSFAWHACLAARAKDGDMAEKALDIFAEAFVLRNGFNANGDQTGKGYSRFTYRPFTLEANFAAAAGLQEMLLQSHTDTVEVFPAIPESWKDVVFHNLRAEGAFLISAERKGGEVVSLKATAERDGTLRIRSPKSGEVVEIAMTAGQTVDVEARN